MNAIRGHFAEAFDESVRLLLRLHELFVRRMDESDAANEIRDQMDRPWHAMSQRDQDLLGELSADLYTISDPVPHAEAPLQQEFREKINRALIEQRYFEALHLLRQNESQVDPSAASFLRGVCWSGLGIPSAAAEFFLHAERSNPGMLETRLCVLSTLISSRREKEALAYVEQWTQQSDDPALMLKAAEVHFLNAVRYADEHSRETYSKSIELAERALTSGTSDYVSNDQLLMALLQIAVAHVNLGDNDKAREYLLRARQHSPDNVVAMMVDGMLNDSAPPVSNAGRREVALCLVDAPASHLAADSPVIQHSQHLQQICTVN